eukprot:Sspe_Gene.55669::Locus_30610_Transcript_1_1_Confidence_1.000_Length_1033::g.55669::m.55669
MLTIEGLGEYRFAYRSVKKKRSEPRPILCVGDIVECRLSKSTPPKAVSIHVIHQENILTEIPSDDMSPPSDSGKKPSGPKGDVYIHDPYSAEGRRNLFEEIGGVAAINSTVDQMMSSMGFESLSPDGCSADSCSLMINEFMTDGKLCDATLDNEADEEVDPMMAFIYENSTADTGYSKTASKTVEVLDPSASLLSHMEYDDLILPERPLSAPMCF